MFSIFREPSPQSPLDENHDLICDLIYLIKPSEYKTVIDSLVDLMVSDMPQDVLEKLTGNKTGDDEALEMLLIFYDAEGIYTCLSDSLKLLSNDKVCSVLNKLFSKR
jgi:hypothetical protein